MKMSYYPGCSLTGTSAEYDHSVREVAKLLDIELEELSDWNCCGASSGHMTDHQLGVELSVRNLDLAAEQGRDLIVPCSACFQRLRAAQVELQNRESYQQDFDVLHLTRFLSRPEILKAITARVPRPLKGLKIACYYGCLSLRPPAVTGAPDYEDPRGLDILVQALGAEGVRWSHKTECCSSSLSMTRPDIARTLVGDIVRAAQRGGARALVTDCPMCQANLESRQLDLEKAEEHKSLPVFFISELVAFALTEERRPKRWKKHLVDPRPLLEELGLEASGAKR
jgi:heterodisulfide reductase subunit B